MISGKISKLFSVLLLSALTTPVFSSESEEFNDDMLLAQRSSSDNENKSENENKKTSRNERSARPTETRPARPSDTRPARPQAKPHAPAPGHAHHHDPQPPHHHHHHHGGDVVVVVEDDVNYTTSTSNNYTTSVSKDCDLDRFMLFANLGCGASYRGFSGEIYDVEEDDGDDSDYIPPLGYNIEVRCDVELTKHLFVSSGVGFAKQSIYNKFLPGNYMYSTKRFLEIPLLFGYRKADDEDFWGSLSVGPRFAYGVNGVCREYYDFYPSPEHGVFEHNSYGGKYGSDRFSVGVGLEANMVINKFLLGFDVSFYPKNDCLPEEIYKGLYRRFHTIRTNFSIKAGWRIF
ncbi:MAG: PorT family protein [Paludibacteraceae bacterium]|nr:PorT family protein [Paludibacteraceae bacterium]